MKLAHLVIGALAMIALPVAAFAEQPAETAATLFPGVLDVPIADGSNVPDDCAYPASLTGAQGFDLACVVAAENAEGAEVGIAYIAWLGENGWRRGDDIIGGFTAVRETENGCEQVLDIFPHGEEEEAFGVWFALRRLPRCAIQSETP